MTDTCTYCDSDLARYDPLSLSDDDGRIGQFCNYACLSAYVEENQLTAGDACEWSPADDSR